MLIYMIFPFLLLYNVPNCAPNSIHSYILLRLYLWDCLCDLAELIDMQEFVYGVMPKGLHKLEHASQSVHDSGM